MGFGERSCKLGWSGLRRPLPVLLAAVFLFLPVHTSHAGSSTDREGRTVLVPDNPVRIVSLAPSLTEIVFALGEGHRLKGVTQHCDFPREARALPKVGTYVHLDLERIVALKPDLCISIRDGNPRNAVEKLQELGIPVYAVDPRNLDSAVDTLLEIGRLLNTASRAEHLANDMRARIERVRARVAETERRPSVFFQVGIVPIVSVGKNTVIHELITAAGGRNLADGAVGYPRLNRERVLALRPEIIIITSMTREQDLEEVRNEWKHYAALPAVRNGRLFIVDANLFDRPTPRLVEGLEALAGIIHPELF